MKIEHIVTEGEVVAFPKKHRGDISDMHSCPKCGGDTHGGKYQGHEVQVCIPCKQVYLPPNSGIDQQGNKISEDQLNEYLVKAGMPVEDVLTLNLFQDFDPTEGCAAQFPEFAQEPLWKQVVRKYAPIAAALEKQILALNRPLTHSQAEEIDNVWYDGSDAYDDMEIEYLVDIYNRQIATVEAVIAGELQDDDEEMYEQGVAEGSKMPTDWMGVPTKSAKNDKKPIKRPSGYDEYIKQGAKHGFQDDPTNPLRKKVKEQGVAEGEFAKYENGEMDESDAVAAMFTRLAKQGRDPIDLIAHKFGWGTYELDDLAQQHGFNDSAEWLNSFNQGVAEGSKEKTPGVALSKAYKKDFDGNKPGHNKPETALTGTYSKTGKPGGELKKQDVAEGYFDDEDNEPPYQTRILDRQTKKVIADEGPYESENEAVDRAEAYLAWAKTKGMSIVAQVYQPELGKNYVTWQVPDEGDYTVKEQGVTEAAKGILHRVRYQYDDPSGAGIASGHITLHAPDKAAAARYAASDLSKKGKKNVKVLAVTPQQQGVAEGLNFNDKKGKWEWDDGTYVDPDELTTAQKQRIQQWKADNPGKRPSRASVPDTREPARGFGGRVFEAEQERKRNALWAQITSYEKRAKATKNDIKKQHLLKMADELRGKLAPTNEERLAESLTQLATLIKESK